MTQTLLLTGLRCTIYPYSLEAFTVTLKHVSIWKHDNGSRFRILWWNFLFVRAFLDFEARSGKENMYDIVQHTIKKLIWKLLTRFYLILTLDFRRIDIKENDPFQLKEWKIKECIYSPDHLLEIEKGKCLQSQDYKLITIFGNVSYYNNASNSNVPILDYVQLCLDQLERNLTSTPVSWPMMVISDINPY